MGDLLDGLRMGAGALRPHRPDAMLPHVSPGVWGTALKPTQEEVCSKSHAEAKPQAMLTP